LYTTDEILEEYNKYVEVLDNPSLNTYIYSEEYLMPDEYKNLDIEDYIKSLCKSDVELDRVNEELILFGEADALDFLKYMKYLVDTMNSMRLVWGVGRGSSVSVYLFYLLGIHKVDCIKYDIDYSDFFKIKE